MLLLARRLVETCGLCRRAVLRGAKAHLQGQTRGFIPSWEGKATNQNQSSIAAELLSRNRKRLHFCRDSLSEATVAELNVDPGENGHRL